MVRLSVSLGVISSNTNLPHLKGLGREGSEIKLLRIILNRLQTLYLQNLEAKSFVSEIGVWEANCKQEIEAS